LNSLLVVSKGIDIGLQLYMLNHFRILLMYNFRWLSLMVLHFQCLTTWIPIKNARSFKYFISNYCDKDFFILSTATISLLKINKSFTYNVNNTWWILVFQVINIRIWLTFSKS
jgi:hypothetical protein